MTGKSLEDFRRCEKCGYFHPPYTECHQLTEDFNAIIKIMVAYKDKFENGRPQSIVYALLNIYGGVRLLGLSPQEAYEYVEQTYDEIMKTGQD